ncbi:MAG: PilZ domain-containing protein [Nitrospirae bacterium]|nr:MAG: PilZ domain-containing protein [Nitrospirota bacterium]
MGRKRELFRVHIVRKGIVRNGSETATCAITELTSQGIGLSTDLRAVQGDRLDLTFDLTDRHRITCTLLVTHVATPRLGGCIAAISTEHQQQLTRYIEAHAAINLTVF